MADIKREELQFDDSQKVNNQGQAILGTLEGCCADTIYPTRNGRKYSEKLWEKVFNSPIVKELFNCGGILGELDHPQDRTELDTSKVAICMPEPPTKKDGKLWGKWHILDTPNGRIAATLAKYGYKLGISSRGSGDLVTDYDGQESVDPDTYEFTCFDLVIIPAVEAARLSFHEGLERKKTLNQALAESLNNANADDRRIMEESLEYLGIKLNEGIQYNGYDLTITSSGCTVRDSKGKFIMEFPSEDEAREWIDSQQSLDESIDDIDAEVVEDEEVDNNEAMIEQLQNALRKNIELENQILDLQEKLSVCYAKESTLTEDVNGLKKSIVKLSETSTQVNALKEKLNVVNNKLQQEEQLNEELKEQIKSLDKKSKAEFSDKKSLRESVMQKNSEIGELNRKIDSLNEEINSLKSNENSLKENISGLNKELSSRKTDYVNKLSESNKLVEKYKNIAKGAVDRYIKSQALRIGVTPNEVKNRLPESYTFSDIDDACDYLQGYKVTMNKLPFKTGSLNENMSVRIKSSNTNSPARVRNLDDDVDEQLMTLAGLK